MPIPDRFVAFVYSARPDSTASVLAKNFPSEWDVRIVPVAVRTENPPHSLMVNDAAIRAALKPAKGDPRLGVLFAVDQRPNEVDALRARFMYELPVVEVRTAKSKGDLARALRPEFEYFAIIDSAHPATLREALEAFVQRHPDVQVLDRAWRSVDDAADFKAPRLVMGAMHLLNWVAVAWADAKRLDHKRSRNAPSLQLSTYEAMHELMQRTEFDVSDSVKDISFAVAEYTYRTFKWHLKIDLGNDFNTENFCRVYYHVQTVGVDRPVLWIGHCGAHL